MTLREGNLEAPTRHHLHHGRLERAPHLRLVVDDEPEVATVVARLLAALGERDELVAQVEEGHARRPAAQLEGEQPPVEGQRLLEVADLERDVVDAHQAGSLGHAHIVAGPWSAC